MSSIDWKAPLVEKNALSLGRMSFWIAFAISCSFWLSGVDTPETLMTTLMVLCTYNLGKHVRNVAQVYVDNKSKKEAIQD